MKFFCSLHKASYAGGFWRIVMRKLENLCNRYNRHNLSKVVVFRLPKSQYGYKYLIRYSHTGNWADYDDKYRFNTLLECEEFLLSLFR